MNKKFVVAVSIIVVVSILFGVFFINKKRREVITITSYESVAEMSLDDLIGKADLIVIGDFVNFHPSKWNTANGKLQDDATIETVSKQHLSIFTDADFQVAQYLKGDVQNSTIRIRTFGGQVGKDSMTVSGEPTYEAKQTYLLFLYYNTGATANIDPGSYYGSSIFYKITDGKAISTGDEWALSDLVSYIQKALANNTISPISTGETPQTPLPTEDITPTP